MGWFKRLFRSNEEERGLALTPGAQNMESDSPPIPQPRLLPATRVTDPPPPATQHAPGARVSPTQEPATDSEQEGNEPTATPTPTRSGVVPLGTTAVAHPHPTSTLDPALNGAIDAALGTEPTAEDANAERFVELVAARGRPLREFMVDLALGPASAAWLPIVRPVARMLVQGAKVFEQHSMLLVLTSLSTALERVEARSYDISGQPREVLLATYERVANELPQWLDHGEEFRRREPRLVQLLLRQVPGIHQATIDKLRAAHLDSLSALRQSNPTVLVANTGLDGPRAAAILERLHAFDAERLARPVPWAEARLDIVERLRELLRLQRATQQAFHSAEHAMDREGKRTLRERRTTIGLEVSLLLVQLGEVRLVDALERLPTDRKSAWLHRFIELQGEEPLEQPAERTVSPAPQRSVAGG